MSSIFINGAKYAVSAGLGPDIPVTAISNANPAVVVASSAPPDDSIIAITSGWSALTESVAKTGNADTNSFELVGVDTSNTARFPVGEGAGSIQMVTGWTPLTQVRSVDMSGGEQQFYPFQYVDDESGRQRQKPTFKNAMTMTIGLDYDPALPWYNALIEIDRQRDIPVVVRSILPGGATIYYYGYMAFNKVPSSTLNENMQNIATLSLISDPVRYEAA